MHKLSVRLLSAFLTVAILVVSLPLTVFALTNESESEESVVSNLGSIDSYTYELVDRRDEYTKHFRMSDGTVTAVKHSAPVHRLDENGVWQEIDNTLVSSANEYKTSDARIKFAKKTTGNEVLFTLHDGNSKITMSFDGASRKIEGEVTNYSADEDVDEITKMSHLEKLNSKVIYRNILDGVDLEYIAVSNTIKENIILSSKRDSYVFTFTMKLNNMTAELAENGGIIVYDDSNNEAYVIAPPFMYDDDGNISHDVSYTLSQSPNNEYKITVTADENWIESDERMFPVTIDPSLSPSDSNVVDLYVNSLAASTNYSSSPDLFIGNEYSTYWKSTTLPTLPEYAYITSAIFYAKKISGEDNYIGIYQVTSDWTNSLTYNDTVSSNPSGALSSELIDYSLDAPANNITWNITGLVKGWYDGTYSNYGICIKPVNGVAFSRPTYLHSNDYGTVMYRPRLMITYKDMFGFEDYWSYISQSAGLAGDGHINLANGALTFNISTLTTTDSLMPFTASLIYNSPLGRFLFTRLNKDLPYSYATTAGGYKTNMNVCIVPRTRVNAEGVSETYYIYTDSDGTEHGFFKSTVSDESNVYYDDDGLKLKLTVESNKYIMQDAAYNKYTFTKKDTNDSYSYPGGFLKSIEDVNGNKLIINTNSYGKPTSIQMTPNGGAAITQLNIAYNSDGVIKYILNPTSQQAYLFYYSSSNTSDIVTTEYRYLRKIVLAHQTGSTSSSNWDTFYSNGSCSGITVDAACYYDYDSNGKMTSVRDTFHKTELRYEYDSAGRVTSVQEFAGANSKAGQKVGLEYGVDFTKVRTSGKDDIYGNNDDIYTVYTFDNEGRCVSTYSTDISGQNIYGATSGEYVSDNEKAKNSLKSVSTVSDISTNYLVNSNFEINGTSSLSYWSTSGSVSVIPISFTSQGGYAYNYNYYDSDYNIKIAAAAGATSSIKQTVALKSGTYTLSAAVMAVAAENLTVRLRVKSLDNTSTVYTEEFNFRKDLSLPVDAEETLSFDVNTSSTERFEIYLEIIGGSGATVANDYVRVAHMTLAKSLGYAANNKVNYGSFETSVISSGSNTYPISTFWTSVEGTDGINVAQTEDISGNALKVVGSGVGQKRYVSQIIYQASQSEINHYIDNPPTNTANHWIKQYRISARGYSDSDLFGALSTFGIRVIVTFIDTDGEEVPSEIYIPFNKYVDTWQYVSETVEITSPFVSCIEIRCEFNNQIGTAYFDDISFSYLGTDNSPTTYTYDENGMPRSVESGYDKVWYTYVGTKLTGEISRRSATIYNYSGDRVESVEQYRFIETSGVNWGFDVNNATLRATTTYTYNSYGQPTVEKTTSTSEGDLVSVKTYNTTAGSHIFGALTSETDSLGRTTRYFYDSNKGYLLATLAPDGNGIVYEYDVLGRMTYAAPAKASSNSYTESSSAEGVSYYYDSTGKLYSINNNYNYYDMSYDEFGNMTRVGVSDLNLAAYEYKDNNGKLSSMTYGNGDSVKYEYDTLDRIEKICYKESGENDYTTKYEYKYDSNGYLHTLYDYESGQTVSYKYDASGRLIEYYVNDDASYTDQSGIVNEYDVEGRIKYQDYRRDYKYNGGLNTLVSSAEFTYNTDNSLGSMRKIVSGTAYSLNYSYDNLGRMTGTSTILEVGSTTMLTVNQSYTYATGEFIDDYDNTYYGAVSGQIAGVSTSVNGVTENYTYTYNDVGYITHIYRNGSLAYSYSYDDLGQLTRENNADTNRTYVYTYDTTGNILSKKVYGYTTASTVSTTLYNTYTYDYGKTDWNDLLQGYNGVNFSHDDIGNPLTYYNGSSYTFKWKQGRKLQEAKTGGVTYTYTYNDEGIRTAKMFDYNNDGVVDVTHYYHLAGSQILSEEWTDTSEVTHLLVYNYDADGTIMGMSYRNSTYTDTQRFDSYLFIKNIQGDVIHIYDENGNKVVSYTYDAWGNITSTTGSMASTIGKMNPFRYRGYYYDEELGFYYLNTRYYDPKIGRFINADGIMAGVNGNFKGYNLFAYCFNDPINMTDDAGDWPSWNDIKSGYKKLKKWVKNNIVTPVKDFANDCKNYEKYNEDVNKVFESKYFSSYKGKLVIRFDESELLSSFSVFDTVFLEHRKYDTNTDDDNVSQKNNLLNHEYGHLLQEDDLGTGKYLLSVALPSVIYNVLSKNNGILKGNYYNMPWEYDADMRGGVNRGYSSWAPGISDGYMSLWR